ncbi:hypothetical protein AB4090_05155 [Acidithiobacillus sp. IBUN Pt1247-S3]|uniref:hypothetical protein n=1 Tax=Acidithiobacillus sp. IBUN Pt1247-S3 TaxID=3166642 RepID=UPI0034E41826
MNSSAQDQMISNLTGMVTSLWPLLIYVIIFTGILLCGWSIWMFIQAQRGGNGGKGYVATFFAGVFMTNINAMLNTASESFFNTSSPASLTLHMTSGASGEYGQVVSLLFDFLALIGLYAYYRAFLLLREAGEDRHAIGPALWHFAGGVAMVNAQTLLQVLGVSVGGLFQQVVQHILG